jgi:hypothetical protein
MGGASSRGRSELHEIRVMAHDFLISKHKRLTGPARLAEESRRAVIEFGKKVQSDRLLLLSIVTGGMAHWLKLAGKAFRGFLVDQQMLEGMFQVMVETAGPDPKAQFESLQRAALVNLKIDRLKGLARHITDVNHLDAVLDKHIPDGDEKAAIRAQMIVFIQQQDKAAMN